MKANKIEYKEKLEECAEKILTDKMGWTQFTTWARERYGINNRHANTLWKETWNILNEQFSDEITTTINSTIIELEAQKTQAMEVGDRRTQFEITKYINKIKGGEVERQEITHKGDIKLNFGFDTPEE